MNSPLQPLDRRLLRNRRGALTLAAALAAFVALCWIVIQLHGSFPGDGDLVSWMRDPDPRFIAPARLGELTRGVPAAWAAQPVSAAIHQADSEPPPVWPDALGTVRGQALEPLHPAAIQASQDVPELARLMSIIDSLRAGDVRVREVAATVLRDTLRQAEPPHRTAA